MTESAVDISGVEKRFGDLVAVRDLDLRIERGEFFSIIGPSGCGKTTTLRMIAGFEDPTAGRISVGGRDMTGVRPYRRPVNTVLTGRRYGRTPVMSRPPTLIRPAVGSSNPAIIRSVVVLPQPDGPMIEKNSPRSIRRSRLRTATSSPKRFSTPLMSTAASLIGPGRCRACCPCARTAPASRRWRR